MKGLVNAMRRVPADLRRAKWYLRRAKLVREYLEKHDVRKLHVGCGPNRLAGWLNTDVLAHSPDVVYLNATTPFPFEKASIDYVFSEHVIEHLTYLDGQKMLGECHRVLKPGGRIRIATPNLLNIIALATPNRTDSQERYIRFAVDNHMKDVGIYESGFVINNFFWEFGHFFVYDPGSLKLALERAGFTGVEIVAPGESRDPNLCGLETHGKVIGEEFNRFETMVLEARRP